MMIAINGLFVLVCILLDLLRPASSPSRN